jgi:putative transposase
MVYHAINRGNGRARVFHNEFEYQGFVDLIGETCEREPVRVLGYCLMPNHFHLVLRPAKDGGLGRWMQRLLTAHVRRYCRQRLGSGHVWQGRFKAFPVQDDAHLLTLLRYVERNPLRAGLARKAQNWRWSSAWWWGKAGAPAFLHSGPLPRPGDWAQWVNSPQTPTEVEALRRCLNRGAPWGDVKWVQRTAKRLGLEFALRPRGRPRKEEKR